MIRRILLTLPSILIIGGIYYVSDQPNVELPDIDLWQLDKFLHIIAYFVLGCTLALTVEGNFRKSSSKAKIWIILIIGALFAIADEFHQSYVPGRSSDIYDIIADLIGIGLSLLLFNKIADILKKLKIKKS
jgi:VanZ family protein